MILPMISPEYLLLSAAAVWILCGGLVGTRAPPLIRVEAGLLFVTLGVAGGGAGLSVFLPAAQAGIVLSISIIAFAVLPIVATVYLLVFFPNKFVRQSTDAEQL